MESIVEEAGCTACTLISVRDELSLATVFTHSRDGFFSTYSLDDVDLYEQFPEGFLQAALAHQMRRDHYCWDKGVDNLPGISTIRAPARLPSPDVLPS